MNEISMNSTAYSSLPQIQSDRKLPPNQTCSLLNQFETPPLNRNILSKANRHFPV